MEKRINLKTVCVSATITVFIFHIFITFISSDIPRVQGSSDEDMTVEDGTSSRAKKLEEMLEKDDMNEVNLEDGRKFKLYEKKRLQHKKAQSFCKKREGKLVGAINVDEMRRLQLLLMKARMIGDQIWIGADKKSWKKYSQKMTGMDRPNLGPEVMAFGGNGPTEMCPALSTSTRSLIPAPCHNQLPFICEFDPGKGKLKKEKKSVDNIKITKKKATANMKDDMIKHMRRNMKDEMRRRKREVLSIPFSPDDLSSTTEDDTETSKNSTFTTITSVLDGSDDDNNTMVTPTSPLMSFEPYKDFIAAHKIGFIPRIVSSLFKQNITDYPYNSEIQTLNNFDHQIERIIHPNKRMNTGDIHLKFSTKLILQADDTMDDDDPDQQMLDLINEQSASLLQLDDTNTTEEINGTKETELILDKLNSTLKENLINLITTLSSEGQSMDSFSSTTTTQQENTFATTTNPHIPLSETSNTQYSLTQSVLMNTSVEPGRGARSFSQPSNINFSTFPISQHTDSDNTNTTPEMSSKNLYNEMINSTTTSPIAFTSNPMGTTIESMAQSTITTSNLMKDMSLTISSESTTMTYKKSSETTSEQGNSPNLKNTLRMSSTPPNLEVDQMTTSGSTTTGQMITTATSTTFYQMMTTTNSVPEQMTTMNTEINQMTTLTQNPAVNQMSSTTTGSNTAVYSMNTAEPNSPVYQTSTTAQNSPIYQTSTAGPNSPVYETSTTAQNSPVYQTSTAGSNSPVYQRSTTAQNSPVYQTSTTAQNSPIYDKTTTAQNPSIYETTTTAQNSAIPNEITTTTPSGITVAEPMFTTTHPMSKTTVVTTTETMTEDVIEHTTFPSPNTTPHSLTATAPKTTIDPMTQPMPTMSPTSSETLESTKSASNKSGKSFSYPGKLTPTTNMTHKIGMDSHHKEVNNSTFNSLLHPRGTVPTKIRGSTSTSTSSPGALLTLRIKSTMRSSSSKRNRATTTHTTGTGANTNMKTSIPTLLKPQNST